MQRYGGGWLRPFIMFNAIIGLLSCAGLGLVLAFLESLVR